MHKGLNDEEDEDNLVRQKEKVKVNENVIGIFSILRSKDKNTV